MIAGGNTVTFNAHPSGKEAAANAVHLVNEAIIGNKLLMHMSAAYRLIDGDAQDLVPDIKPLDQRTVLLSALPEEYESKQLYSEAHSHGVCVRTATRWNDYWQQQGLVQKIRHGVYRKVA